METVKSIATLSDAELLRRVDHLARRHRELTVELLVHLSELDRRKLHVAAGYGSLFSYCTQALRLSEHAAYNRIEAARLSRTFPAILDLLAGGALTLSTVRLVAPHLTLENCREVLAQASGRSKREVEELVARLAPRPDVAASVRKLPVRASVPTPVPGPVLMPPPPSPPAEVATRDGASAIHEVRLAPAPPVVAPLAPARYRVQFTVGQEAYEKLRRVQDLLRREIPEGDPGAIFERALTLLLDDIARQKLAASTKPRGGRPATLRSRHVPAEVKRAVWGRDEGRCTFVARGGQRCRERAFLEFHHRDAYALGGETTVANVTLHCRAHNRYEAERVFGPREADDSPRDESLPFATGNSMRNHTVAFPERPPPPGEASRP